ncbi:hypothetical protein [Pseudomonas viciae]|uniref:hypothetical protein n=1 Tax=Pseudomonas viciae TaxID=2505979 RepID=UPI002234A875|nr:hypothetical protein [Pseudomonas viciae]UZE84005.1 hypothetical protein LOY66_15315 [Pseudomonas viciae]
MLWYPDNLGVAQGYGKNPRDSALLKGLAVRLGIPCESFILSAESKIISAQQYLMAMLETLEPLSVMFQDIWLYCERSLTKTSRDTLDISWNFNIHGQRVTINFEAFRRYRQLLAQVPPKELFNDLCNDFAEACKTHPRALHKRPLELPVRPDGALRTSVTSRIYDLCAIVLEPGLQEDGYWGTADVIPALWAIRDLPLWDASAFSHLREKVDQCVPTLTPEDILALPFWRQRWQIYELWCLVNALGLFEQRGFELTRSPTGASLLELGQRVVIAERKSAPLGQIVYQPSYQRRAGNTVHPDIVVVRGDSVEIEPDDVAAIIECKQHKMPDDDGLKGLKKRYFDAVAASYSDAVASDGKLVLLNYDSVDFEHAYVLIGEFRPDTRHLLEASLKPVLASFSALPVQPLPVLIVDGSLSMERLRAKLHAKIAQLHHQMGTSQQVVWLGANGLVTLNMNAIAAQPFAGSESVELFLQGLQATKRLGSLTVAHIITDLSPNDPVLSELAQACAGIPFRVHSL